MVHAIKIGWYIIDKYYALTNTVPIYTAALLLNPLKRKLYLIKNQAKQWHDRALNAAYQIWEEEYKNLPPNLSQADVMDAEES